MRSLTPKGNALFALLLAALVGSVNVSAQTAPTDKETWRLTLTAQNVTPGAGEMVRLVVFRWSTDEERAAFAKVVAGGNADEIVSTLKGSPSHGYVFTSGAAGYFIRYAVRLPQQGGGDRIILATERPLGAHSFQPWRASSAQAPKTDYPYTLIELRLNAQGQGEGKMSMAAGVTIDPIANTVALWDYPGAPVLLRTGTPARAGGRGAAAGRGAAPAPAAGRGAARGTTAP